jgi:3-isopropylmalate/(R)-2-methylmalate dehydratase small subunit
MRSFSTHAGIVAPLDRANVDTDQMVPKQFCKLLIRGGYGRTLFYDWRYLAGEAPNPNFVLNQSRYQGASILLTRDNFGCGSSREHAPWALFDYGFRAIIALSYADIFYNNCFKNGLLPIVVPKQVIDSMFQRVASVPSYRLRVDLEKQLIIDDLGHEMSFLVDAYRKKCLLQGLDDIAITLEYESKIVNYENSVLPRASIYSCLD